MELKITLTSTVPCLVIVENGFFKFQSFLCSIAMVIPPLDLSPGIDFSNKVRSLFNTSVTSSTPDDAHSFCLFTFFARSKIKLDVANVSLILQSLLGGVASDFAVVEVKD
jgi:hypothetical protein